MASLDFESENALYESTKLKTVARVKELYFKLLLAYKNIDGIKERGSLFSKVEEAALSLYSLGRGSLHDVIIAQTKKYILVEKEEMLKQKIRSLQAMLNALLGRDVNSPLERPIHLPSTKLHYDIESLLSLSYERSPEVKVKENMLKAAKTKLEMAKRE